MFYDTMDHDKTARLRKPLVGVKEAERVLVAAQHIEDEREYTLLSVRYGIEMAYDPAWRPIIHPRKTA